MNEFNVGDEVTWTRAVQKGSRIRISTMRGKIVEFDEDPLLTRAIVRLRNGHNRSVQVAKLRSAKQQSALGEGLEKFLKVVVEEKLIP